MHTHQLNRWLAVPLALALAILACGGGGVEPSATPFLRPTQRLPTTAAPTQVAESTLPPAPTRTPRPAATPASDSPITLDAEPYTHFTGAFSIYLPEGWEISERDNSVFVDGPGSIASIEVGFVNAGIELDDEALANFIAANEANWFGTFNNYVHTSTEPQSDGSIGVLKTMELSDGTPQTVFSYYWQEGTIVYEQDFWVDSDQYDAHVDGFLEVANSMVTDPDAVADVSPYAITYTFTDPHNGLFTFQVPYAWTYTSEAAENTILDSFVSPDGLSYVDSISYDDGQAVSRSDAGRFALALLREFYEVSDIRVTNDVVQPDGSERLDWNSPSGGFEGTSFFETRGTTFLLLTWIVDSDYYDVFFPVWDALVGSYTTP
jgi:hypothetical protein